MTSIGIKGYSSYVDAEKSEQELEIRLGITIKAKDYAKFQEKLLGELQDFLDERK